MGITTALPGLIGKVASAQTAGVGVSATDANVVYGKGGDVDLHCDVYKPAAGSTKRMAIIHFHGGGFGGGNKDGLALEATDGQGLRQHRRPIPSCRSRLDIVPARIAVAGYSAGGHFALFAAATPNRPEFEGTGGNTGVKTDVAACLAYYAVTGPGWEGFRRAFPMPEGSSDEAWRLATPGACIKTEAPTVLFHGLADVTVPPESSLEYLAMLREANVPSESHTSAGVPDEFMSIAGFAEATSQLADFFLERHVISPRTYPAFGAGRGGGRGGAERGGGRGQ